MGGMVCKCAPMMNRNSSLLVVLSGLGLAVVMASQGCDKNDPPIPDDNKDLAAASPDLSHNHGSDDMAMPPAGDMAMGGKDMAMPPTDMAMSGPKVTGLPTCTDRGVTADTVFTAVAKSACSGCHSKGAGGLTFTDGASFRSSTVGKKSGQAVALDLVKASSVDGSYLIYKVMNQQTAMGVGGSGAVMPKSGKLPDADLCKFIVWVQEGAK